MAISKTYLFSLLLLLSFGGGPEKKTRVWLVGDSTMANKELKAFPETGWGMPFAGFFDSTINLFHPLQRLF